MHIIEHYRDGCCCIECVRDRPQRLPAPVAADQFRIEYVDPQRHHRTAPHRERRPIDVVCRTADDGHTATASDARELIGERRLADAGLTDDGCDRRLTRLGPA